VGEASIALATACYGISVNGNSGHDENDVLYIAFPVPAPTLSLAKTARSGTRSVTLRSRAASKLWATNSLLGYE
jgi:hypothetical protein